jgi:hypothetical protein
MAEEISEQHARRAIRLEGTAVDAAADAMTFRSVQA